MLDDDRNVALGLSNGVKVSNNVALFLSKKVTEAQREIVHQLRTEVVDHTRSETAEKESDKGHLQEKTNAKEGLGVQPDGDTNETISLQKQLVDITV